MKKLLLSLTVLILLNGCSTLVNGSHQEIAVKEGCTLSHEGNTLERTVEGSYLVPRGKYALTLECGSDVSQIKPKPTKEALAGVALLDFGIVDLITGNFWGWDTDKKEGDL